MQLTSYMKGKVENMGTYFNINLKDNGIEFKDGLFKPGDIHVFDGEERIITNIMISEKSEGKSSDVHHVEKVSLMTVPI